MPTTMPAPKKPTRSTSPAASGPNHEVKVLYLLQAELCRVMGHPLRIEILDLLSERERTATELREWLGVGKVNLSQHLSLLKRAGLIRSQQKGRESVYSLAIPEITDTCHLVRRVLAARLSQGLKLARTLQASAPESTRETPSSE